MTEQGWPTCTDYLAMLIYLRGEVVQAEQIKQWLNCEAGRLAWGEAEKVTGRKLGLVAIEMCHRWYVLPLDGISRHFLKAYEKWNNGEETWDELQLEMPNTPLGVAQLGGTLAWDVSEYIARDSAAELWKNATEDDRFDWGFFGIGPPDPLWQKTHKAIVDEYPPLLREIIGNPHASIILDPTWLTSNVATVAQSIYDNRAFDRLPVLADALEEAGCHDAGILSHCRSEGPHVRGCWAVDLVLGKQ